MSVSLEGIQCFLQSRSNNLCRKSGEDCQCHGIVARQRTCLNPKCGKKFKSICGCHVFCDECSETEADWFLNIEKIAIVRRKIKRHVQIREANANYRASEAGKLRRAKQAKRYYQRRRSRQEPGAGADTVQTGPSKAAQETTWCGTVGKYCSSIRNLVSKAASLGKTWAQKTKHFLPDGQVKEKSSSDLRRRETEECSKLPNEMKDEAYRTDLDKLTVPFTTTPANTKVYFNSLPLGGQGYLLHKKTRLFPKIPCMRPGCRNEFSPDARAKHKKYCSNSCRQAAQHLLETLFYWVKQTGCVFARRLYLLLGGSLRRLENAHA